MTAMRIGVTYDLRADYLALGITEEDDRRIRFRSSPSTASDDALARARHERSASATCQALAARLVAGERWDLVFNICRRPEGPLARGAGACAARGLRSPYVFSDPLTLAALPRQGGGQAHRARRRRADAGLHGRDSRREPSSPGWSCRSRCSSSRSRKARARAASPRSVRAQSRPSLTSQPRPSCSRASASRCWSRPICPAASSPSASSATARRRGCSACCEILLNEDAEANVYSLHNKELCEELVDLSAAPTTRRRVLPGTRALAAYRALRVPRRRAASISAPNASGEP